MKIKTIALIGMVALMHTSQAQQPDSKTVNITNGWKILVGDNPAYVQPSLDDKNWKLVNVKSKQKANEKFRRLYCPYLFCIVSGE